MNIVKEIKSRKNAIKRKKVLKDIGVIAASAATGAVVGATGAVLFAPRSGKETREAISNRLVDSKDAVVDKAYEVKYTVENKIDVAKEKLENIKPFEK